MFPVPRPYPKVIPFIVGFISLTTCSIALSINDRTKAGIRNAGHRLTEESFLAAGSNHMSNEFWSTGKNIKKEDNPKDSVEPNSLVDGRKPSKRRYLDNVDRLNSFYDPRNYVDDRIFGDNNKIKIKNRKKDQFKRGSDPRLGSFYPDPTVPGVADPRQNGPNWVMRNDGVDIDRVGRVNLDAKLKNDKIYFERQYPNHDRINHQNSYLGRNPEDPTRSGYSRRREMSYDYNPYGQGFGQEQIYYYYYDPDVDSLSLGFNSHNRHHMGGNHDHVNEDVILYPDDASDTPQGSPRLRKKYKVSEAPKFRSLLKEQKHEVDAIITSNIDSTTHKNSNQNLALKTITKISDKVEGNNTASKTVTTSENEIKFLNVNVENDQQNSHEIIKEEPTAPARTTMTRITSTENSSYSQVENAFIDKEKDDMIQETLENQIGDYQSLKPDISPYRMAVSDLGQNGTNASLNDSSPVKLNNLNSQLVLTKQSEEHDDKRNITNRLSVVEDSNEISKVSYDTENKENITNVSKSLDTSHNSITTISPDEEAAGIDNNSFHAKHTDWHQKVYIDSRIKSNVNDHIKFKEHFENESRDSLLTEETTTKNTFSSSVDTQQTKEDEQIITTGTITLVSVNQEKISDPYITTQVNEDMSDETTLPVKLNLEMNGTTSTLNKTSDALVDANSKHMNSAFMNMHRDFLRNILMMPSSLLNNFTISSDRQADITETHRSTATPNEYNNTALYNMTTVLNYASSKNAVNTSESAFNNTATTSPISTPGILSNTQTNDIIESTSKVSMDKKTYEDEGIESTSTTERNPPRTETTRSNDVTYMQHKTVTDRMSESNFTTAQLIPDITNTFEKIDSIDIESVDNKDNRRNGTSEEMSNRTKSYRNRFHNESVFNNTSAYNLSAHDDTVKIYSSVEPSHSPNNMSIINSNEDSQVDYNTINSPASRNNPSFFSHSSGQKHYVLSKVSSSVRPDPFKRLFSLPVINSSKDIVSSDVRELEESRHHLDTGNGSNKPSKTSISINYTAPVHEQNNTTETNWKNHETKDNFTNNQDMLSMYQKDENRSSVEKDENRSSVTYIPTILTHELRTLKPDANNINTTNLSQSKNEHEKINAPSNHVMNNDLDIAISGVINEKQKAFDRGNSNLLTNTTTTNNTDFVNSTSNNKKRTLESSHGVSTLKSSISIISGGIEKGMTGSLTDKPNTSTFSSASGSVDRSDVPEESIESQEIDFSIKLMSNETSINAEVHESQFVEYINNTSYGKSLNTSFISKSLTGENEDNITHFDTLTGSYPPQHKSVDEVSQERLERLQSIHSTSMNNTESTNFNVSSSSISWKSAIPLTQSNMSLTQSNVTMAYIKQNDDLQNRNLNFKANQNSNPPKGSPEFDTNSTKRQIEPSLNHLLEIRNNSHGFASNITEKRSNQQVLVSKSLKNSENKTGVNISEQSSSESELNETMLPFGNEPDYEDIQSK